MICFQQFSPSFQSLPLLSSLTIHAHMCLWTNLCESLYAIYTLPPSCRRVLTTYMETQWPSSWLISLMDKESGEDDKIIYGHHVRFLTSPLPSEEKAITGITFAFLEIRPNSQPARHVAWDCHSSCTKPHPFLNSFSPTGTAWPLPASAQDTECSLGHNLFLEILK